MNTIFVILVWTALYYLFFHPLTEREWYMGDKIMMEFYDPVLHMQQHKRTECNQ